MPNIKSAKKRVKTNEKRAQINKDKRSNLNTVLKKTNAAIESNADNKDEMVKVAVKKIDQAASSNLIHKNKAARKKAQIMTKANS